MSGATLQGNQRYYADRNSARYTGSAVDLGSLAAARGGCGRQDPFLTLSPGSDAKKMPLHLR